MRDSTRLRILLAAEQLFAERGVDGVSLREIGAAAGQRNNSAVQYHFGDRDGLLRALYELRLEPLNLRRTELLDALTAEGRTADLVALVDAYARPLFEVADGTTWYARFVARDLSQGPSGPAERKAQGPSGPAERKETGGTRGRALLDPPLDARYTSAVRVVTDLLRRALAGLPANVRAERTRRMQLYVTSAIADVEARRARGQSVPVGLEASLRDLVATAAAMLAVDAPVSTPRDAR